jgi:hypothetical protein
MVSNRNWQSRPGLLRQSAMGILFLLALSCGAFAFDVGEEQIDVKLEVSYATKYIWQGYDSLFDDQEAIQPTLEFSWRGFTAGLWGSWATDSGYVDLDELNYYIGYDLSLFEEDWYAVDLFAYYYYCDFPKSDSGPGDDGVMDNQEINFGLSMPALLPIGSSYLVPGWSAFYEFAGKDTKDSELDNGWVHEFSLAYDLPFDPLLPDQEEQYLSLTAAISYNDGVYWSDPDWSHSTISASTTFEWNNFYFTPTVNYQWSFEDTVNDENEFYATFAVGYCF